MPLSSFKFITLLIVSSLTSFIACQSCYYPNGNLATVDQPCSPSGDGPCCPLDWACLTNGLCYLENANYFERRTCTDQTWQSSECPNICTQNGTATGNEAILQCSDGSYCCDGNRSWDCCAEADTIFFSLSNGNAFTTIGAASVISPVATSVGRTVSATIVALTPTTSAIASSSRTSATTAVTVLPPVIVTYSETDSGPRTLTGIVTTVVPTSPTATVPSPIDTNLPTSISSAPASSSSRTAIATAPNSRLSDISTVQTVISSNSQGIQTVYITSTPTPSPDRKASNLGTILGCAIGIPLSIAALSLLAFLLLRRRRKQARNSSSPQDDKHDSLQDQPSPALPREQETTASPVRTSEIYGKPVQSPGGVQGKSELDASPSLSQTSSLPAYSPDIPTAQWSKPVSAYQPYRPIHELPRE